ncbi:MAG TPA: LLM class flavin-dependent oxidoreductase [Gaiellaceae bacterium]|nr:LLM class flavin-dependent oxidoreductase [Gaiellaceae bacterium]
MTRELGLGLQSDKRPGEYAALARIAEDAGFDVLTVFNDLFFQPSLPPLLEIAQATERVRVGASCLNPFTAHPVEIAGQVAALDAASNGRAYLGLAAGAWLDRLALDTRRSLTAIRETWAIVSALLAGDDTGVSGELFTLAAGTCLAYEPVRRSVPLLVGTWSPRLTAFAAEEADELKIGGCANPDMVRLVRERLGSSDTRLVVGAVTVVDEDDAKAREHAEREVELYLPVVAKLDPTVTKPELDQFAFAGDPSRIAEHAHALFEASADRVEFGTPHGVDERRGVELLGERVLPALAQR